MQEITNDFEVRVELPLLRYVHSWIFSGLSVDNLLRGGLTMLMLKQLALACLSAESPILLSRYSSLSFRMHAWNLQIGNLNL